MTHTCVDFSIDEYVLFPEEDRQRIEDNDANLIKNFESYMQKYDLSRENFEGLNHHCIIEFLEDLDEELPPLSDLG